MRIEIGLIVLVLSVMLYVISVILLFAGVTLAQLKEFPQAH